VWVVGVIVLEVVGLGVWVVFVGIWGDMVVLFVDVVEVVCLLDDVD